MRKPLVLLALACGLLAGGLPAQEPVDSSRAQRARALKQFRHGERLKQKGDFAGAAQAFESATELNPLLLPAFYELGQSYMALQRYDAAASAYTACKQAIDQLVARTVKEKQAADHRRDEEIRDVREIVNLMRQEKVSWANDTLVLKFESRLDALENGRWEERHYQTFDVPPALSLALGSAHFRAGRLEDAASEYRTALAADPQLGAAHNNLAVVYMLTGRIPEAQAELQLAEKAGFDVSAQLKADLARRAKQDR